MITTRHNLWDELFASLLCELGRSSRSAKTLSIHVERQKSAASVIAKHLFQPPVISALSAIHVDRADAAKISLS
jgi:hypothetical protein